MVAFAALDLTLALGIATLVAIVLTTFYLRGDLLRAATALLFGFLAVAAAVRVARGLRRLATELAVARAIAATPGPLHDGPASPTLAADRVLRHEILGAMELADPQLGGLRTSQELIDGYIGDVGGRLVRAEPRLGLGRPRLLLRLIGLGVVIALAGGVALAEPSRAAASVLWRGRDARPLPPPGPVWSKLTLELHAPAYSQRPLKRVQNPSGVIRALPGTQVELDLTTLPELDVARVRGMLVTDPLSGSNAKPPPEPQTLEFTRSGPRRFIGSFEMVGSGSLTVLTYRRERDGMPNAQALPIALEAEVDAFPEVELRPLPKSRREPSQDEVLEIEFRASDDFGLSQVTLVYEDADGTPHRVPGPSPADRKRFEGVVKWDLGAVPMGERSEVVYSIEVRDNDAGLGLAKLSDPPGKVSFSARQRLQVRDEQAEHDLNIQSLRALRDQAVDLLAARLTTSAFDPEPAGPVVALEQARDLHAAAAKLLTDMSTAIDALAQDTMVRERDAAVLVEVHRRLMEKHRDETTIHEDVPPGTEYTVDFEASDLVPFRRKAGKHNVEEVQQLEDEIIRLDDLVDGQLIAQLETLTARLETSQQKLVELLEALKAGDESVRPQIDQLQDRIREDLRKLSEARSQLRKEVGGEYLNLDAFLAMEKRIAHQDLSSQLDRGDVDAALEQARSGLEDIRDVRDAVQNQPEAEQARLTPEEQARMKMLRELSRLKDDQESLQSKTDAMHEAWRKAVGDQSARDPDDAVAKAQELLESLEDVNDARLGRDARQALEDAKQAVRQLESAAGGDKPTQLELQEAAQRAADALEQAAVGSSADESDGKAVRSARDAADKLARKLRKPLPSYQDAVSEDQREELEGVGKRQGGLGERAQELSDDEAASILPKEGRKALDRAIKGTDRVQRSIGDGRPDRASRRQDGTLRAIQQAIDSLRQGGAPPPPPSGGDASTETSRDRSLRDEMMDAMREGAPDGFDDAVERYYEELLR